MFGGGKGMGGGGGGRVLKVLGKSVARAGVTNLQETFSSSSSAGTGSATSPTSISRSKHRFNSSNNSVLSLSSAAGSPFSNAPVSANNGGPNAATSWPYFPSVNCDSSSDEFEWISVDGSEEERTIGCVSDDTFLGPVPSLDEVQGAVSALTQILDASAYSQFVSDRFAYDEDGADQISSPHGILRRVSPAGSDLDWVEPSPHLLNSRMLHPYGPDRVYDAFHLLQSEPAIQKMVISLSSDKAVWNAVLNNEVVRQLRDSYNSESVTSPSSESSEEASEDSNPAMNVAKWIFQNTMAKFMEVMQNISNLLNELFKAPPDDEKKTNGTMDPFEDKLRVSFLLSVVVLLVVVVSRANTA